MPLWAISVSLVYALRRVYCPQCGIVVERVPWTSGKDQQTNSYRLFPATWAKRMSWQEVAVMFGTTWDSVFVLSWTATAIKLIQIVAAALRHGARYRCCSAENRLWRFWHGVRI